MQQYSPHPPYPPSPTSSYYGPPPQTSADPKTWDYGFSRNVSLIESPPVGASFIAITLFFLIVFASNYFSGYTLLKVLGLSITLSVLSFMALIILVLFLI